MEKTSIESPIEIFEHSLEASKKIASRIAQLIIAKKEVGQMAVLGLATGSSPIEVYNELVRMHREEALSFQNVITFNLDEYFPMAPDREQSYHRFMNEYLFDHVDILPENIHIPDGTLTSVESVNKYCQAYEEKIDEVGGIDLQILGIGRTGHIGFNEPGSTLESITRLVTLDNKTRVDATKDFFGKHNVPKNAVTMGISTILKSKQVVLMAWGEGKAEIVERAINGHMSAQVPATFLQNHMNVTYYFDMPAASELAQVKTPWLLDSITWDALMVRKAVVWLCEILGKPILTLTNEDYNENGLSELLTKRDSAYKINIEVFNQLQHTITGWPGGKPNADDSQRPERNTPFPKRTLIFSPHPDDDVISMGGTLLRLVEQGHEVHVAYQVSGNIAVFDEYAYNYLDFMCDYNQMIDVKNEKLIALRDEVRDYMQSDQSGNKAPDALRELKGQLRKNEAKAACRYCGVDEKNLHFMNLPFYETGEVKKKPLGEEDIQLTMDLLQEQQPHQVFLAGDLSDPHGTHRVCLEAIFEAMRRLKNEAWTDNCKVWMYRGAWQEWDIADIEMAVPISPEELMKKRQAIFRHQSQKDGVAFPGSDAREFWQRAEDRNRHTARQYDKLGMAQYEAMEAFVEWDFKNE
ncbi:glucosamine-6-phosphate deaminase [Reichenbachiella agariperforans]|uniref:Glucosamine-6-phosphate deaminase n=1 Tax=Reichenbachiella agariperforans TaxID=156994 RepID=A0A1M6Q3U6_REIAG|nr:glucosamine-6-phosphate deaminase [Reichenbachiella agariperforans]MBU2914208.1 glucosamine-6-phosphate deaminase [Reichenbachiella agariperforans]SHK14787.1 glucosamine-6-phosphate deaminase [Reichenbachiella agariperforans]